MTSRTSEPPPRLRPPVSAGIATWVTDFKAPQRCSLKTSHSISTRLAIDGFSATVISNQVRSLSWSFYRLNAISRRQRNEGSGRDRASARSIVGEQHTPVYLVFQYIACHDDRQPHISGQTKFSPEEAKEISGDKADDETKTTFAVPLSCEGCVKSVSDALYQLGGITKVEGNVKDQIILVEGSGEFLMLG